MKVDGTIESLTESEQMIVFAIAAAIIISVLIFLARGSIFRKKNEYDTGDNWKLADWNGATNGGHHTGIFIEMSATW